MSRIAAPFDFCAVLKLNNKSSEYQISSSNPVSYTHLIISRGIYDNYLHNCGHRAGDNGISGNNISVLMRGNKLSLIHISACEFDDLAALAGHRENDVASQGVVCFVDDEAGVVAEDIFTLGQLAN